MTEYKVWRSIVDWVEDNGGRVIAACPPGSSVYDYKKFCIIDPVSGKRDEPDILFIWQNTVYFVECKPTLRGIYAKGLKQASDESDIDKLRRIEISYRSHHYDQQLLDNYGIDVNCYDFRLGVGYSAKGTCDELIAGITQFVVSDSYSIKIMG